MIVGTIPSIEYKQDPGRGRAKAIVPAHEHEEETGCRNLAVDSARQERKRGDFHSPVGANLSSKATPWPFAPPPMATPSTCPACPISAFRQVRRSHRLQPEVWSNLKFQLAYHDPNRIPHRNPGRSSPYRQPGSCHSCCRVCQKRAHPGTGAIGIIAAFLMIAFIDIKLHSRYERPGTRCRFDHNIGESLERDRNDQA